MTEEEIETWYEEEKQKAYDELLKEIESKKDRAQSEKRYGLRLEKIKERYNRLHEKILEREDKRIQFKRIKQKARERFPILKKLEKFPLLKKLLK
jgi:hypothetical protein